MATQVFEPKGRLTMSKKRSLFVTICALAGAFGAASVQAQDEVKHFKFFGGPAYVAPLEEDDVTLGAVSDSLASEEHVGWNLGFEGRFGKLLGLELDYINSNQDLEFGGVTIGDTNFSPVTLSLNFHFGTKFDFYVGPSYSYINWSDIELADGTGELSTESTHGFGVNLGL